MKPTILASDMAGMASAARSCAAGGTSMRSTVLTLKRIGTGTRNGVPARRHRSRTT